MIPYALGAANLVPGVGWFEAVRAVASIFSLLRDFGLAVEHWLFSFV